MRAAMRPTGTLLCRALLIALAATIGVGCGYQPETGQAADRKPRQVLFVGVDVSGSFHESGYYDNAMGFLAHYLYGHLNEQGGLWKPRELFVATIGGAAGDDPKAFHPIHDLEGKEVPQIEAKLREWFAPTDKHTDFNAFFRQIARIAKERNLHLTPITVLVISDGIPDVPGQSSLSPAALYRHINLKPLDYLSKNVTVRLAYANPKVGQQWRTYVSRDRVRLWAVEADVMKSWRDRLQPGVELARQEKLWKWVRDNVDFRVRSQGL
jgi:hypothetical protein